MGKHLNEELGYKYVGEMYSRSYFVVGDTLHMLRAVEAKAIHTHKVSLKPGASREWEVDILQPDVLKDFTSFSYPTLGYREFATPDGKLVTFLSTKRTALRGLRDDHLISSALPIYNALPNYWPDRYHDMNSVDRLRVVFRPTFTPFKEGLKALLNSETPGFAINEQLAVGIATNAPDRDFEIYFRQRPVGSINKDGKMTLSNKVVQRPQLRQKLEM